MKKLFLMLLFSITSLTIEQITILKKNHIFDNIDLELIQSNLIKAEVELKDIVDKDIVMLMGNSKSGKTSLMLYLLGYPMCQKKDDIGSKFIDTKEELSEILQKRGIKIGTDLNSESKFPNVCTTPDGLYTYCDTPGLKDNRQCEERITASLSIEKVFDRANNVLGVIFVINGQGLFSKNAYKQALENLLPLRKIMVINNINPESVMFAFTHTKRTKEEISKSLKNLSMFVDEKINSFKENKRCSQNIINIENKEEDCNKDYLLKDMLDFIQRSNNIFSVDYSDEKSKKEIEAKIIEFKNNKKPILKNGFNFSKYDPDRIIFEKHIEKYGSFLISLMKQLKKLKEKITLNNSYLMSGNLSSEKEKDNIKKENNRKERIEKQESKIEFLEREIEAIKNKIKKIRRLSDELYPIHVESNFFYNYVWNLLLNRPFIWDFAFVSHSIDLSLPLWDEEKKKNNQDDKEEKELIPKKIACPIDAYEFLPSGRCKKIIISSEKPLKIEENDLYLQKIKDENGNFRVVVYSSSFEPKTLLPDDESELMQLIEDKFSYHQVSLLSDSSPLMLDGEILDGVLYIKRIDDKIMLYSAWLDEPKILSSTKKLYGILEEYGMEFPFDGYNMDLMIIFNDKPIPEIIEKDTFYLSCKGINDDDYEIYGYSSEGFVGKKILPKKYFDELTEEKKLNLKTINECKYFIKKILSTCGFYEQNESVDIRSFSHPDLIKEIVAACGHNHPILNFTQNELMKETVEINSKTLIDYKIVDLMATICGFDRKEKGVLENERLEEGSFSGSYKYQFHLGESGFLAQIILYTKAKNVHQHLIPLLQKKLMKKKAQVTKEEQLLANLKSYEEDLPKITYEDLESKVNKQKVKMKKLEKTVANFSTWIRAILQIPRDYLENCSGTFKVKNLYKYFPK